MSDETKLERGWWRDRATLLAEYEKHGTIEHVAYAHDVSAKTLYQWWRRHGLPHFKPGAKIAPNAPRQASSTLIDLEAWLQERLPKVANLTLEELADEADVSPKRIRAALETLVERGFRVELDESRVVLERVAPATDFVHGAAPALFDGELVRFGVVSDTHLGSKEERLEELHTAYEILAREGVTEVFHPGDLVAGMGVYRHQIRDLKIVGFDEQVEYAIENYPRQPGITTRIISGNHDLEGEFGRMAADPVTAVCNRRDDFKHLGHYSAWVELPNGGRIHVLHPGGGASYALSYKLQRLCEGYEGGRKPSILLAGHYHRRASIEHRGIESLMCGTFEGATSLAKRYGMGPPAIGFHICEAVMADDGSLVDFTPRWLRFFPGRKVQARRPRRR